MVSWHGMIMPEMYGRLNPYDPKSKWDFSLYRPDVVVINLFQNDSWLVKLPENENFKNRFGEKPPVEKEIISAYRNFVSKIRGHYPEANIICMLGNMDVTQNASKWPHYITKAVKDLIDSKIHTLFVPFKNSPGHPSIKEQTVMADTLVTFIERNIKW